MKYEIMYSEAFPIVKCQLERGEKLKAESDAMITMSATIDVEGKMNGGLLSGLARKFLTGESFFCQELIASRGAGEVLLGHSLPGGILDLALNGSYGWRVQKGSYMASTEGIEFDTKMQNLSKGLFSGEGFFILNVKGSGTLFVSSFGAIHPLRLADGEEIIIDNGNLVAWPDYMDYTIEKASSGWISGIKSGECLVTRFRGPGTVLIQTRNPSGFEAWIRSMVPAK
jgi:uncharacterized protein (TIGR00266 family)